MSDFSVDKKPIEAAAQALLENDHAVGLGFEEVLAERFGGSETGNPPISLTLQGPTVRSALDALCKADSRYAWSFDGTTVNLFPRDTANQSNYLMNRRLTLRLEKVDDIQQGLLAIVHTLPGPAEQVAIMQVGGDSTYPPAPWTVNYENITVRQAINRLVEHMGTSSWWFFGGAKDFRRFTFFRRDATVERQPRALKF